MTPATSSSAVRALRADGSAAPRTATTLRRPSWHGATVAAVAPETPTARRIELDVPSWPGSDPGQHLDLRLTAEDGYQATRSYSIASTGPGTRVTLAVDRVDGGEVSPFLVEDLEPGATLEVLGPLGGWFVWHPGDPRPVQLVAGGSGVVPFVAMIRAHAAATDPAPFRLLHAVRTPDDIFFADELAAATSHGVTVEHVFSRAAPPGRPGPVGRLTRERLAASVLPPEQDPAIFLCGSTPFVEQVIRWLAELGHHTGALRAERFGGSA